MNISEVKSVNISDLCFSEMRKIKSLSYNNDLNCKRCCDGIG